MRRPLTLRQVEAFKAVFEYNTVNQATKVLRISQPSVSRLIATLEEDAGIQLFDRIKGRLVPTKHGRRLYAEIDKIFFGLQQVERIVEAIRREDERHLSIGLTDALSGAFIQRSIMKMQDHYPNILLHISTLRSQSIVTALMNRSIDVGLTSSPVGDPYVCQEILLDHPLVCALPPGHPLATRNAVGPSDLDGAPFISFDPESYIGHRVRSVFELHHVQPHVVLTARVARTLCEFVAAGLGVSLIHPLFASDMSGRLIIRPFEPALPFDFRINYRSEDEDAELIRSFAREVRSAAEEISRELQGCA